jgi:hypothetical protein
MKIRASIALLALVLASSVLLPGNAPAAPYWDDEEVAAYLQRLASQPTGPTEAQPPLPLPESGRPTVSYAEQYARIANFERIWQVSTPGPDFGGIREGEHLQSIIQTDNTSESIWVWTRYYELTGDNQYYQNIVNSFTYSLIHPAYLEEGDSSPQTGYYRMYNCGWAVRAEMKFRDVYGVETYHAYADSCASYLRDHSLTRYGNSFYDYVNPPVLSWAMGNLYAAGLHEGRPDWINAAVQQSRDRIKLWVETQPILLGNETWAMSGGATMWGLLNSYFQANPDSTQPWLLRYKQYMDTFSSPGDFQNAWNGWYALGHRATGLALDDPYHLGIHSSLTDYLVSEDGDGDGGIPARPQDTDQMDQTWVTNYLAFMGLSDCLGPTSALADQTPALRWSLGPNPARESARVAFDLSRAGNVTVSVHDASGRQVTSLLRGETAAGAHLLDWNASRVPAGVYWINIQTPEGTAAKRLVHIR